MHLDGLGMHAMASNLDTLVTVFGGSGFLGRSVVRALAKRDYRIRVAVRRPELANGAEPVLGLGQEWCPGKDSNLHGREATGT